MTQMELSLNEKRLLAALKGRKTVPVSEIAKELGATGEATLQFAHLCSGRGLAEVTREVRTRYTLTAEGKTYAAAGSLPERQLLDSFPGTIPVKDLQRHPMARIGIGWMKKKGWVSIKGGTVEKTGGAPLGPDEVALTASDPDGDGAAMLAERGILEAKETVTYRVALTAAGRLLLDSGLDLREEVGTLTREMIVSGVWKDLPLRRYRVDTPPRRVYPGKVHPYQVLMEEMRMILLEMGFTELYGDIVQSAFWNFDALFQPQDHPAREMQDTFYLGVREPLPPGADKVREMHEGGGGIESTGWGGTWSTGKAEQCVLRTHTTLLSIQHLALHPEPPVKAFAIGRVYRREAIDPTHLPEFEQLEGIVMDRGVNFRHLLGYLREFYTRMGFPEVRFRPGYFPYTEPSVEPEVYVEGLGWVELGGAGIFRKEVTAPWGIEHPVLAWGLGVSRVAMLRLGLRDLRELYRSDIGWIRDTPSAGFLGPDPSRKP
jgi:phenylalanyl-tRNA synthetase alpha chain